MHSLGSATETVEDHTNLLGSLRKALWDMRAKWEDLGIDLGISIGTIEVSVHVYSMPIASRTGKFGL